MCQLRASAGLGRLAPLKVEVVRAGPRVEVVHDLLGAATRSRLATTARTSLVTHHSRSRDITAVTQVAPLAVSSATGQVRSSSGRVGKVAFLRPAEAVPGQEPGAGVPGQVPQVVRQVREVAGAAAGLDPGLAESLQATLLSWHSTSRSWCAGRLVRHRRSL